MDCCTISPDARAVAACVRRVALLLLLALPVRAEVTHVVLCWFRADAPAGTAAAALAGADRLESIPGLLELRRGTALPSDRPIVDDSFDIAMTMRFASEEAMRSYLAHPDHTGYVESLVKPWSERILIYDLAH